MTIQQKIKDLESKIEALKSQEIVHPSSNLDKAPIICELNGYKWLLGPEAKEEMTWEGAKEWCHSMGGELPPREILFLASLHQDAIDWCGERIYWSGTEFDAEHLDAEHLWVHNFNSGDQYGSHWTSFKYVRAVRKVLI